MITSTPKHKEETHMAHLYIVKVFEDGEKFEYEYGNLKHAREHFDSESHAVLVEYKDGKYDLVRAK